MPSELFRLTVHEAARLLARREVSSTELTRAVLDRIEAVQGRLNAFVTVTAELALEQAREADERLTRGEGVTPLTGIPAAIKDVICTRGVRTTCGSRMLENFVPPYDATVIERLKAAGLVMVGKTNMDEFAMGSSGENSYFGPTRNPWDEERVPGGSSSGSAAAVAADACLYALGSDTGGSIRQPAALCGIVGLKPTYGRVSRYGLVAFASSLDQIGPMTKDVTDAALVLQAIAGHDPRDSTSAPVEVPDYAASLVPDLKGLRLGVPREYMGEGVEEGVRRAVEEAIDRLQELGAEVDREVSLPSTPYALACYYIIAPSEASANLARYDGVKYGYSYTEGASMWENMERTRQFGFGAEVKRRIMLGTYALSAGYYDAYYLKAQKVRTLIRREFEAAFQRCDALVTPVSPTPAFRLGEKMADPLQMYLSDVFTIPVNIAGLPSISVPCGFSQGLPVGLQVIGRPFDEPTILRVAYAYEQATDWHLRRALL
ncbi:MAG: Asp-tRNA(Asn)/Glu-tRNA(Gln) amidotransferase subunit GatA [Dehalococcoidia bacterium]|nr:Asp-tRNA(Asn)/Glu-tRNA(Gln) amidotransferase subunit GatA [Dehalococcoidia bacterium]MDW8009420.1 Asp-tRNA(Asn)/Glu-tRNA(Gln) amidotransferase subunit GatA [Chloroflexota bacterium]